MNYKKWSLITVSFGVVLTAVMHLQGLNPPQTPDQIQSSSSLQELTTVKLNTTSDNTKLNNNLPPANQLKSQPNSVDIKPDSVSVDDSARFSKDKLPDLSEFKQHRYKMTAATNDPYGNQDWEQQTKLNQARDKPLGNYVPTVAVIDSGFALNHEDLSGVWLTNDGESGSTTSEANSILNCSDRGVPLDKSCNVVDDDLNGVLDDESGPTSLENQSLLNCTDQSLSLDKSCNLIDDDSNGLVDDYIGFDFINYERSVTPGETNPDGDGVNHGSLVTGIIAAHNNNSLGLAGSNPNVKILPIQALDDEGFGYSASVADSILYAVSRGADIISLSLGSPAQDSYLEYAIDYATEKGVVVIAAAGNDGCSCLFYPASYKPVVSVGATDAPGSLASFSNYGPELDIVAPGVNLISSSWSKTNTTSLYQYASGTSLSTPVVSGLFSRAISYQQNTSPIQLKALLFESADKSSLSSSATRSDTAGYGFTDALTATNRITTPITSEQIVTFDFIRSGGAMSSEYTQQEVNQPVTAYSCPSGQRPATTIYRLTKNGFNTFTASEQETVAAKRAGFTVAKIFDSCILLPHDSPSGLRTINTLSEFLLLSPKNLYD